MTTATSTARCRSRGLLVVGAVLVVLGALAGGVATYRRRALDRAATEFHRRYDEGA